MSRRIVLALAARMAIPTLALAQPAADAIPTPIEKSGALPVPAPVRDAARQMAKACAAWSPALELRTTPTRPVPVDDAGSRYWDICSAASPARSQVNMTLVMTIGGFALVGAVARLGYFMSPLRFIYWALRWLSQSWRRRAAC